MQTLPETERIHLPLCRAFETATAPTSKTRPDLSQLFESKA